MAYICNKPAGSCESCEHYRFDKEEQRMACFEQMAIDKVQIKTEIKTETIKIKSSILFFNASFSISKSFI